MSNSIEMTNKSLSATSLSSDDDVRPLIKPKRIRRIRKIASNNIINVARIAIIGFSLASVYVGATIDNEYVKNIWVRDVAIVAGALGISAFVASFIPHCNKSYRTNNAITPVNV